MTGQPSAPVLSEIGAERAELEVLRPGALAYRAALALQEGRRDGVLAGNVLPALFLLEHPPTVTLGSLAGSGDLLATAGDLAARGIELHQTNRGGRATYHGPGQLIGYPVLDLRALPASRNSGYPSVRSYLRGLEETMIRILAHAGIEGRRREGAAGVWVGDRKIGSVGVAVRRWVTTHGFALNVRTDLMAFHVIRPCGFAAEVMTSMEREGARIPTWSRLEETAAEEFSAVFGIPLRR